MASQTNDPQSVAGPRLVRRAATVFFPSLVKRLGGDASRATSELLRLLIQLYATGRGLNGIVDDSQEARDALAFDDGEPVDFATLPVRHIGELYELLLAADRGERKARGSFYTPQPIVDYMVRQTIGPVFQRSVDGFLRNPTRVSERRVYTAPWCLQILDPAMGSGHFLVAATRDLAERLMTLDDKSLATAPEAIRWRGDPHERLKRVMHYVATQCMGGIDLDPLAVALARACLWLEIGWRDASPDCLDQRLLCGDALSDRTLLAGERFDCILGNPPYGSRVDPAMRKRLVRLLPQMKHNGDTAVGFLERSSQLLADNGRCGLIVPKPLTYSFAWRNMRQFLARRVEQIVDVSRAWPEVKLEQIILIFGRRSDATHYDAAWLNGHGFSRPARLSWRWADRFGTLPCALDAADLSRLDQLQLADTTVGDLAKTWRGLPLQRRLQDVGEIPVLGGRDVARWRTRGASGYVAAEELAKLIEPFQRTKLLFQNIIAHVANPTPHILLIGAYDDAGSVTLDTVNNLTPREPGLPLEGLLALLHSRLVNWFVYSVIYNKAIRTMHFDQYFLNKVPLPLGYEALLPRLAELAQAAQRNELQIAGAGASRAGILVERRVEIAGEIDRAVERAYAGRE